MSDFLGSDLLMGGGSVGVGDVKDPDSPWPGV